MRFVFGPAHLSRSWAFEDWGIDDFVLAHLWRLTIKLRERKLTRTFVR